MTGGTASGPVSVLADAVLVAMSVRAGAPRDRGRCRMTGSDSASERVGVGRLFGVRKNSVSTDFDATQMPPTFRAG